MRCVAADPCRIPYSNCTPKFECPVCNDSWDSTQIDYTVFGRFLTLLKKNEPTENSSEQEGWDKNIIEGFFDPFE